MVDNKPDCRQTSGTMLFEEASELKKKGNKAYKQKNYIAAFRTYSSALHILNGEDISPAWIQLQFDLHSNQVQTCIMMSKYDGPEHMDMIEFALRHKDNMDKHKMSKALYRCGRFFESVKDPVEASGTYQTSLDYDPDNSEAQAALKRVNVILLGLQDPALQNAADRGLFKKGTAEVLSVTVEYGAFHLSYMQRTAEVAIRLAVLTAAQAACAAVSASSAAPATYSSAAPVASSSSAVATVSSSTAVVSTYAPSTTAPSSTIVYTIYPVSGLAAPHPSSNATVTTSSAPIQVTNGARQVAIGARSLFAAGVAVL
ncbi:hypothetical protein IFR05_017036, partial [Cadophora sp. M221]